MIDLSTSTTKRCCRCKEFKPRTSTHFGHSAKSKDGFNPCCRACRKSVSHTSYEANKDRHRDAVMRWRKDHPEEVKAINRRAWRNNQANYARAAATWKRKNRDRNRYLEARRRSRKGNLPITLTPDEWQETLRYFDHRCAYCRRRRKLVQEHVIPISQGGGYTKDNIVPACKSCNSRKHARTPDQAGMPIRKAWPISKIGT